jgi:5-methylcytosine-specific restriction endonuclease McrA
MEIKHIHRPWQRKHRQGSRYNPDPYYHSVSWKNTRKSFRLGHTDVEGFKLLNIFCIDCYKESKRLVLGSNTDHIVPRKEGGSDEHDNLQTQCDTHHARKSAKEGNERRKK